ncbi:MAG: class I SAM-dependent methyltransferase [bacterium]|nr:SAM-dependent methyltransferase [Deltaproteobacteria bacterium]MCP4909011.1 class I SAM-dependent methyltransferase [bacterium]
MNDPRHEIDAPSALFVAQSDALRSVAELGPILDLACGRGRHCLAAAELGLDVVGLDRDTEHLTALARMRPAAGSIEVLAADLERAAPPDLERAPFGAVLVFRYLHRPLMPWIEELLAPGGLLLYETFTTEQRELGWGPSRDDFLLRPGELPRLFPGLETRSYEEGATDEHGAARTARLVAVKPT